ncbi:MAG: hypothetical protein P8Q36_08830 [Alphaproteobacteria bacterium]|nr:hypothetical protein [Rhodospirillaceae bacterium]MBT6205811.1 hypothetical protein [Rhodospirillaceae bacterium]MBT7613298.1 hypothetical protein [Rhodospirillaceae bacterium]MBT7649212.1 hypothetical protein [Rhodospirillaceae bacterium]MDG2480956.1 hypothetical protein [Alphaproteobacteria bacterium]
MPVGEADLAVDPAGGLGEDGVSCTGVQASIAEMVEATSLALRMAMTT